MSTIQSNLPRKVSGINMRNLLKWLILPLCDLSAFVVAAGFAIIWFDGDGARMESYAGDWKRFGVFVGLGLVWLGWFGAVKQIYARRTPYWTEFQQLVLGVLFFALLDLAILTLHPYHLGQTWWATAWLMLLLLLPFARWAGQHLLQHFGTWYRPTVIVGRGENARRVFSALQSERSAGLDAVSFAWPTLSATDDLGPPPIAGVPYFAFSGGSDAAQRLLQCRCVIALEADEWIARDAVILRLAQLGVTDVHVVPAMRGVPLHGIGTSSFFSHEVLLIRLANNLAYRRNRACKRTFDIVVASVLLLLLSPVFLFLAYKVSRDGGSAFFSHVRVGRQGHAFPCYKFRSMVLNAQEALAALLSSSPAARDEWEAHRKLKDDPRITKIGHFLRRTSLDELPQLWNVIRGDMSLVGPRPITLDELDRYGGNAPYYLMTRPGMTGLWQVSGRNDIDYARRVYLDSWYVKNWSLWSDIDILFKTIAVVSKRSGAY